MQDQVSAVAPSTTTHPTTRPTGTEGRPVCSWVPVTDATGRTRLEARWSLPAVAATPPRAA